MSFTNNERNQLNTLTFRGENSLQKCIQELVESRRENRQELIGFWEQYWDSVLGDDIPFLTKVLEYIYRQTDIPLHVQTYELEDIEGGSRLIGGKFSIRKIKNKDLYSVKNAITGAVHSHHATKANATKQIRLLQAIDHGFIPKKGGARVDPKVKMMYDYLSSLYPQKTLLSVAKEIIKIKNSKEGKKLSGGSRAGDIARYVISAIGIALAFLLALFIQSMSKTEQQDPYNPPPHYTFEELHRKNELDKLNKLNKSNKSNIEYGFGGNETFPSQRSSYEPLDTSRKPRPKKIHTITEDIIPIESNPPPYEREYYGKHGKDWF